MPKKQSIEEQVHESLDNAKENGFDFTHAIPSEVADDLLSFDADLEDQEASTLIPHIESWQKKNK